MGFFLTLNVNLTFGLKIVMTQFIIPAVLGAEIIEQGRPTDGFK